MSKYSVVGQDTNTAATTQLYVVNQATTPVNLILYEFMLGSDATPADQASEYVIRYVTDENATPGGTSLTPRPLRREDRAALATSIEAPTGEPTYTGTVNLLMIGLNQRATFRWVAAPGSEFISADAEDEGFSLFTVGTSSAHNVNVTFLYEE